MKEKTMFVCSECGYDAPKWSGKCPACGQWNTMQEMKTTSHTTDRRIAKAPPAAREVLTLAGISLAEERRLSTGIGEFDRVLGGGAVAGSLILMSGAPGIGKSTLLLQACRQIEPGKKILYVSGEESPRQLKLRADRLGVRNDSLFILSETDIDVILETAERLSPDLLILDSVQTAYKPGVDSAPGSITQVKEITLTLLQYVKSRQTAVFLVGHINKDGAIAGPKVLEHMVDCVLYFEGEKQNAYRILRAAKNRFGSTNEIGVFEMSDRGLSEVLNPSEALLAGRPAQSPGSCVACTMEGTRPILAEIQALVTRSSFGVPRRMSAGFDYNRMVLLLAILEKRAGLLMGNYDAYLNVVGGFQLDEPALDLPAAIALASSFCDRPVADSLTAMGEVGLAGEIRSISNLNQRLSEVKRIGFTYCIVPETSKQAMEPVPGLTLIPVKTLRQAVDLAFA